MWAAELVSDRGRFLVYYAGRKKDGPLCVAVATAEQPTGPWQDHGPIVCQPDGSIDPAFARDEHGTPYLIWKEDGNSQRKPTPIWAQPLSEDLLHLRGEKHQLIVNDAPWEAGVVEGPFVLRHAGRFYLFYAGNACCGASCNYAEGVARASFLLGPWQKDPANPIIAANHHWKCPGHGSIVHTTDGRDVLVYHSYPANGAAGAGRESLLDTITWGLDAWPTVNGGRGPSGGR
jgi:beta-xylosidase